MMRAHFVEHVQDALVDAIDALFALRGQAFLELSEGADPLLDFFSFAHVSGL